MITGKAITKENQNDIKQGDSASSTPSCSIFAVIALFVGAFIIYNTFSIIVAQRTRETGAAAGHRREPAPGARLGAARGGRGRRDRVDRSASLGGHRCRVGLKALLSALGFELPGRRPRRRARARSSSPLVVGVVRHPGVGARSRLGRPRRIPPVAAMRDVGGRARRLRVAGAHRRRASRSPSASRRCCRPVRQGGERAPSGRPRRARRRSSASPCSARDRAAGRQAARRAAAQVARASPATLARENAVRNPRRTAATAAALMIGVGLVGVHHGLRRVGQGVDQRHRSTSQLQADYIIDSTTGGSDCGRRSARPRPRDRARCPRCRRSAMRYGRRRSTATEVAFAVDPAPIGRRHRPRTCQGRSRTSARRRSRSTRTWPSDNGWKIGTTIAGHVREDRRAPLTVVGV